MQDLIDYGNSQSTLITGNNLKAVNVGDTKSHVILPLIFNKFFCVSICHSS